MRLIGRIPESAVGCVLLQSPHHAGSQLDIKFFQIRNDVVGEVVGGDDGTQDAGYALSQGLVGEGVSFAGVQDRRYAGGVDLVRRDVWCGHLVDQSCGRVVGWPISRTVDRGPSAGTLPSFGRVTSSSTENV